MEDGGRRVLCEGFVRKVVGFGWMDDVRGGVGV